MKILYLFQKVRLDTTCLSVKCYCSDNFDRNISDELCYNLDYVIMYCRKIGMFYSTLVIWKH